MKVDFEDYAAVLGPRGQLGIAQLAWVISNSENKKATKTCCPIRQDLVFWVHSEKKKVAI